VSIAELPAMYESDGAIASGFVLNDSGEFYLDSGAVVNCYIGGTIGTTNKLDAGSKYNYWAGVLVREMP